MAVAWQRGGIIGIGRKAFPTDRDTNGEFLLPIRCYAVDYDKPRRIIELPSGRRAVLCAC